MPNFTKAWFTFGCMFYKPNSYDIVVWRNLKYYACASRPRKCNTMFQFSISRFILVVTSPGRILQVKLDRYERLICLPRWWSGIKSDFFLALLLHFYLTQTSTLNDGKRKIWTKKAKGIFLFVFFRNIYRLLPLDLIQCL